MIGPPRSVVVDITRPAVDAGPHQRERVSQAEGANGSPLRSAVRSAAAAASSAPLAATKRGRIGNALPSNCRTRSAWKRARSSSAGGWTEARWANR